MRSILIILYTLFAMALPAQKLEFRHLSVKDGLPHNSILALQQDSHGLLWVATMEGLVVFDGQSFASINTAQLPNNRVDRILLDGDGKIWVRCLKEEDILSVYDTTAERFVAHDTSHLEPGFVKSLQAGYTRRFADPYSSRCWQLDRHLLWQTDSLNPDSGFAYTDSVAKAAGLNDNAVYSLLLDNQGILWVGTASNGLFFADTRQQSYSRIICSPSPLVRTLCKDSQDNLYIALSDQSLAVSDRGTAAYRLLPYTMSDPVEGRRIRALLEDSRHRLWMGTRDGLYTMSAKRDSFQRISLPALPRQHVYSLCEESGKWLWIGTDAGLFRKSLERQDAAPELVDTTYSLIYEMASVADGGILWVATERGLYRHTADGPELMADGLCRSLAVDPQGSVWAGTSMGLYRWNNTTGSVDSTSALSGHTIQALVSFRDYVWCSYESGVCCVNIFSGHVTWLRTEDNEYLEGADFCDYATGHIYFGGTQGLDCFDAMALDKRLRSTPSVLWLKEQAVEWRPTEAERERSHFPWTLILVSLAALAVVTTAGFWAYKRIRRKDSHEPQPALLTEEPSPQSPAKEAEAEAMEAEADAFVEKATSIMEAHLSDDGFSVEQFAAAMCMSRTKFFTLMKAKTGKTVMEFVRDARMAHAVTLLSQGMVVADVAMKCGYGDTSNFRRTFVKKFGKTPSEFKANLDSQPNRKL